MRRDQKKGEKTKGRNERGKEEGKPLKYRDFDKTVKLSGPVPTKI